MKKRVRQINFYLMKRSDREFGDVLKNPSVLHREDVSAEWGFEAALFLRDPKARIPWWLKFLQTAFPDIEPRFKNVSNAAVLLVRAGSRMLAITFGYGKYLLDPDCYESDFGLKVALNTINPERLRSVDVRTIEELTLQTRKQASRGSSVETFGLDVTSDLLRGVTGEPRDADFAKRVTGADALVLILPAAFGDLGKKCEEILRAYESDSYKEHFSWIDHLRGVRDANVIQVLDTQMVQSIRDGDSDSLHMAPPEPVDWEQVEGFSYSTRRGHQVLDADMDFDEFFDTVQDPHALSSVGLRKARVLVKLTGMDRAVPRWSVYSCLVFETDYNGSLYVLSGGRWFCVERDFAGEVQDFVGALPVSRLEIPRSQVGEWESDYNKRAANSRPDIVLMDRQLARCGGGHGPIEVCDLFTSERQFVHVKRKYRSSTLSHLFAQGTVSAEAFLRDENFRSDARSILTTAGSELAGLIPAERPLAGDFEVVFAIITGKAGHVGKSLPFFSKLHLMQAARRLQLLGYKVGVYGIPFVGRAKPESVLDPAALPAGDVGYSETIGPLRTQQ